jgi:flagellar protein FlgJ
MQIQATTSTNGPAAAGGANNRADLARAAEQFEAIFLRQMIGAMRSASLAEGLTDSSATDQFRDMADARTADSMAKTGSLGIAELLLSQFGGRSAPIAPASSATTTDKPA